jgi:hypothetical protein
MTATGPDVDPVTPVWPSAVPLGRIARVTSTTGCDE